MDDLKFRKKDVLEALHEQLEDHEEIVAEAWEGYKESAQAMLAKALSQIEAGERAGLRLVLQAPADHSADIARAIQMLEMASNQEVTLEEHQFACYVQGQWNWADTFLASNSLYSKKAADTISGT